MDLTEPATAGDAPDGVGRDAPIGEHRRTRRGAGQPSSSALRVRSLAYLLVADCLVILSCFAAAAATRGTLVSDTSWLVFAGALVPAYVITAINLRAYSSAVMEEPFYAIRRGEQSFFLAIALVTLANFYLKSSESFPRLTIALGSVGTIVSLAALRYLFVRHLPAIVGGNPFHSILIRDRDAPLPSSDFSEIICADSFDPESDDPVMYDRLAKSLATADRVVVACPRERRLAWARALRGANIQGEIAIPELLPLSPLGLGPDWEAPSIIVATGPLTLYQRGLKRLFDLALASAALIFLLPILTVVAVLIKLDSEGPVFFKQTRIGRGNKMFELYKFRSMRTDSTDHQADRLVVRGDDRVTRIGRFIRKTSIDELPQLLHVLKGDMSIVGPRPHALGARAASKLYWEVDERYWDRHATKPGLTGLAQVRGFRGNTLHEDDLRNRLRADLEYLENWSIWRDIKIIVLTVRVLFHHNAY